MEERQKELLAPGGRGDVGDVYHVCRYVGTNEILSIDLTIGME